MLKTIEKVMEKRLNKKDGPDVPGHQEAEELLREKLFVIFIQKPLVLLIVPLISNRGREREKRQQNCSKKLNK